jgi:hypothetical protein
MQTESNQARGPLAEEILDAYGEFRGGSSAERAEQLLARALWHICELVESDEHGWALAYIACVEAGDVEPNAVALLASQEAVELVVCGYLIEEEEE